MLKAVGKFLLYVVMIFALVFTVALFGDKLQQVGQGIAHLFEKVQDRKPLASVEHWFKDTLPEYSRDLRRKLMSLREEAPTLPRPQRPTVLSSRDREDEKSGFERNAHEGVRVNAPPAKRTDKLSDRDRQDLDQFFEEQVPQK